ncbi:uncharacterized protein [Leptinotarsa decemlineata]|uniref:uncharacterized protein n=1 Tax=Leptinotarsa decemlineata TaxID=7539 RepID=UPI003D30CAF7
MGNKCCRKGKVKRKIVLLLLGLDNAGKTRAANGLAGDPMTSPVPTVGFSVINLKYSNYDVRIFDLGGGPNIRGIWHKYFVDAHGLIFVVDSSDFSRFSEVKMELEDILYNDKIAGKPLLVLANKQDHENALDEIDIIEYLNIEQMVNVQKCPTLVQSCSANENTTNKLDPGIQRGYEWLLSNIDKRYGSLNQRVEADVMEQEKIERDALLKKIQRIKALQEMEESKKSEDAIETYSEYVKKINGKVQKEEKLSDYVVVFDNLDPSSESSSSSISFPPVYVTNNSALTDRPKSAVEMVKHQLQLTNNTRKQSLKSRSNKTAPMSLFGERLPHSAKERRKDYSNSVRRLKSADNSLFTISNTVTDHPDFVGAGGDTILMNNFDKNRLPPLKGRSNGVPWVHKPANGDSVISVVDIE